MNTLQGLKLDYLYALQEGLKQKGPQEKTYAPTAAELSSKASAITQGLQRLSTEANAGRLGFWQLPRERGAEQRVQQYIEALEGKYRHVLVLGIGGSSLGPRALDHALLGPADLARQGRRVYFPDNSDPWYLSQLLRQLPPKDTLALAISKSGGTVETAAQMLIVQEWFRAELGPKGWQPHMVFITDPERGPLRQIATEEELVTFDIPPSVGGRFSVLSPVGLVPAALAGIRTSELLDGAEAMAAQCQNEALLENPAAVYAALHVLHHQKFDRSLHVLMPYVDALRPFAQWFVQLWAESLGKRHDRSGTLIESGPTPIAAVGATDQHAQVQLFMEGPRDKLLTFVSVAHPEQEKDLEVPETSGDFSYLSKVKMERILQAELEGTKLALASDGRPSVHLRMGRIDAYHIGALVYFFEAATAIAGELYDINAFDQPGVEAGKRIAFALLGREGYEKDAHVNLGSDPDSVTKYRV